MVVATGPLPQKEKKMDFKVKDLIISDLGEEPGVCSCTWQSWASILICVQKEKPADLSLLKKHLHESQGESDKSLVPD
jgi:hypothetical protein